MPTVLQDPKRVRALAKGDILCCALTKTEPVGHHIILVTLDGMITHLTGCDHKTLLSTYKTISRSKLAQRPTDPAALYAEMPMLADGHVATVRVDRLCDVSDAAIGEQPAMRLLLGETEILLPSSGPDCIKKAVRRYTIE